MFFLCSISRPGSCFCSTGSFFFASIRDTRVLRRCTHLTSSIQALVCRPTPEHAFAGVLPICTAILLRTHQLGDPLTSIVIVPIWYKGLLGSIGGRGSDGDSSQFRAGEGL